MCKLKIVSNLIESIERIEENQNQMDPGAEELNNFWKLLLIRSPSFRKSLATHTVVFCSPFLSVNLLGQISLEEFIEGAEKDPWLMEHLRMDIRPTEWFIRHHS